jgi:xylulokinase
MSSETFLGIDIGTASTKGVVTRADGTIVGRAKRPHGVSMPRPGWVEQDAEAVWWGDVRAICEELRPDFGQLAGVCISGLGPCLLPCDGDGRPLRPAILYGIDTRAGVEILELEKELGAETILARSGSILSSQALGPKLLWVRRNEPEIWERTAGWYTASSFINRRLTGEYVLDRHTASQCDPLYDMAAASWNIDWTEQVTGDVPLPRLAWPGEVIGTVTTSASLETGVPAGTPVMAGTVDAWAEAFSAGVRKPGDLMLMYGSTMFMTQVAPAAAPDAGLWYTEGVEPTMRTFAAGMSTSGALTEWLRKLTGDPPWEDLLREASDAPPGARGLLVLPYFAGERSPIYDPDARGVVVGLTLEHGRGEMLRAIYEGVAYGARQVCLELERVSGSPTRVISVGGGTEARLWTQIVSDVTGLTQLIPAEAVGAAYGDALLAAIGTGAVSQDTDWAKTWTTIVPSEESRALYSELCDLYAELYPATASIAHRLAEIQASPGPEPADQADAAGIET